MWFHCNLTEWNIFWHVFSFSADIHSLLPIKNNKIVAASNKSSLGMSDCGLNVIFFLLLSGVSLKLQLAVILVWNYFWKYMIVFCFTVVYSVVRPADDSENLKIVEFKRLSPHRESIRCLISVAGLSMSLIKWLKVSWSRAISMPRGWSVLYISSHLDITIPRIHTAVNDKLWTNSCLVCSWHYEIKSIHTCTVYAHLHVSWESTRKAKTGSLDNAIQKFLLA